MADSNALNVAIIGGAGFMGSAHSKSWALAALQTDTAAKPVKAVLVERDLELARATAEKHGWAEAADDWRSVVDRDDIDIVDVVTPPHLHAEIVCYALERGKHVLCEKPIANAREDVVRITAAARAARGTTAIGFNYRHNAAIRYAAHLVSSGQIGDVIQARFEYHQDDAFGDMGWRRYKAKGGSGASSDIGSHIIDLAHLLVGGFAEVNATLTTVRLSDDDDSDVDDGGAFLAHFDSGALGIFSFSQKAHGHFAHIRFEIDGTEGGIAFDWSDRDVVRVYRGARDEWGQGGFVPTPIAGAAPGVWFGSSSLGSGYLEPSTNLMVDFLGAIEGGRRAQGDLEHGARIQSVVDAVWASAESRSWVRPEPFSG
ncbi:MAG: Gfo/Idh/MocA family oxidoreductase [Microbacterium sp.]